MKALLQLRRELGLTQAELAHLAGTSQPTLAAYESGAKVPSLRTLRRIASSVGMDVQVEMIPAMTREERRSLQLHEAIAQRLLADPGLVIAKARSNLARMQALHPHARITLDEWARILERAPSEIARAMTDPGIRWRELRQVTPFAGVLDAEERAEVYRRFRSDESRT